MKKHNIKINPEDLRVKGLRKRWLRDIIGVVIGVVIIMQIIISVVISNYYYDIATQDLKSRLNTASALMSGQAAATDAEFQAAAIEFANTYPDRNVVEVQFINRRGEIFVSSRGYVSATERERYFDYHSALESEDGQGMFVGRNSEGERIMAVTALMPQVGGESIGAIRFITSLRLIDRNIFQNILVVIAVGALIIIATLMSGLLFLKSILEPIKSITAAAFRIASGKFDDRLPVNDADEIGKLCDTINYMASELESMEKLKNDFISSVSHELRTPLTVIQGWSETVKSSVGVDDELTDKGLSVINSEVQRLSGLVEDLLDFSRMQSGRLQIKKEKVDILAELGEAVYMYKSIAQQKGIELTYSEPKQLSPVMADPARLKQVFINIIDNAIKYSGDTGNVIVEATEQDIYAQIKISDMGCGIPSEELSKVKEKFYKTSHSVRGSGIGLAIADEIVKQHNGILIVDSKEGMGTTVTIGLPFA